MLKNLRLILIPFSLIYGFIILIRNKFYDWGFFKSIIFDIPIICVGNLAVGGSGKTPVTEYLVKLLEGKKIAILSRGYGRKTNGFVLANSSATAETIGDEPLQYFNKFSNVTVAVCEDRVKGINQLKDNHDVILLDDAYQHRAVNAGFNILLFEYDKIHRFQMMLPAGDLRESFYACKRADEILITKSPTEVQETSRALIANKVGRKDFSFSSIKYGKLMSVFSKLEKSDFKNEELFVLTGIANPGSMLAYLETKSSQIQQFEFPDHYQFTVNDIKKLIDAFNRSSSPHKIIVTTEKDSQRLISDNLKDLLLNLPVYYLPIEIDLLAGYKDTFDKKILAYVANA